MKVAFMKGCQEFLFVILFFIINLPLGAKDGSLSSLPLLRTIELPEVHGRIDHMAVDPAKGRLFVAAIDNDSLEIIDLNGNRVLKSIKGLGSPQGVVYLAANSTVYVSCRDNGNLEAFDGRTFAMKGKLNFSGEADNLHYLKQKNLLILGYGSGGLTLIDPLEFKVKGTIALGGHPEGFVAEETGGSIYVNVPALNLISTVDQREMKVIRKRKPEGWFSNFPIALDEKDKVLAYFTHVPKQLTMENAETGNVLAKYDCSGDVDDLYFDPDKGRWVLIAGEGAVEVVVLDEGKIKLVSRTITGPGARTGIFSPELKQLFVAVPERDGKKARIMVFSMDEK